METTKDIRAAELGEFMARCRTSPRPESHLIAILHKAQSLYGYLSNAVMDEVSEAMNIPAAHIWGVATFYHYFNLKPKGKHTIAVCLGTACYVKGAEEVLEAIKEELKIGMGETTQDGLFTLQEARCLGACGLAPVVMIDEKIYGGLTPKKAVDILKAYRKQR
ncbi:MAG: NADH-quinone oxidoreductase subunit NuoE [Candidatus Omnitrophica bacterium]|nr:NADH-quinone oxidoreductase subunit NuoE [Candidatus Omnitrophota bacterium]